MAINVEEAQVSDTAAAQDGLQLNKELKMRDLIIFGIVCISPASAQNLFGLMTTTSHGHAALSYLVGFVAMIFTALCYAKMANIFPKSGSTFNYTAKAIHPNLGFMAGWAIMLDYFLLPIFLFKLSSLFIMRLMPSLPLAIALLVFVIPVTLFNYLGIKLSARLNMLMFLLKLISAVLFVVLAVHALTNGIGVGAIFSMQGIFNGDTFSSTALIHGAAIAVLSYLGFDAVTTMAEESKVSGKMVGRATVWSCVIATFLMISQVYFATLVMPDYTKFEHGNTAFFDIASLVGGVALATFIVVINTIGSGIGTALTSQASGSRVLFVMGRERALPEIFSRLHPKHKTPVYSILVLAVLGYIGAFLMSVDLLSDVTVFGALIGFICVSLSVIVEFFVKRRERSGGKFFSNLVSPAIGLVVCAYILFGMNNLGLTVGSCWLVLGFLYLLYSTKGFKKQANALEA